MNEGTRIAQGRGIVCSSDPQVPYAEGHMVLGICNNFKQVDKQVCHASSSVLTAPFCYKATMQTYTAQLTHARPAGPSQATLVQQ